MHRDNIGPQLKPLVQYYVRPVWILDQQIEYHTHTHTNIVSALNFKKRLLAWSNDDLNMAMQ